MRSNPRFTRNVLFACTIALIVGCTNLKEPAQQAITGIESAVTATSAEAAKYVPDQLADVQAKLGALKASFDQKNYKAVVAGAPAVLSAAQNLATAAAAKKEDVMKSLTSNWTQIATTVPQLIASAQTRLAAFSKHKKLPPGVDVNAAKANLDDASSLWSKAQAAFSAGNLEEAVNTANAVKAKAEAGAAALKMDVTAPATPAVQ